VAEDLELPTPETFPGYDLETLRKAREYPFLQVWEGVAVATYWVARSESSINIGWDESGKPTPREGNTDFINTFRRNAHALLKACQNFVTQYPHIAANGLQFNETIEDSVELAGFMYDTMFTVRHLYYDTLITNGDVLLPIYNSVRGLNILVARRGIVMATISARTPSNEEFREALLSGSLPQIEGDYKAGPSI
jgi:hypothetical protein